MGQEPGLVCRMDVDRMAYRMTERTDMNRSKAYVGKHRLAVRSRRLLVVPVLILSLVSLQTTLAVAGGGKADKQEQKAEDKAAREREKIEKECRERKHKDQGQDPAWRAENNCPEDSAAGQDAPANEDKDSKNEDKGSKNDDKGSKNDDTSSTSGSTSEGAPTSNGKGSKGQKDDDDATSETSAVIANSETTAAGDEGSIEGLSLMKVEGDIGGGLASVLEVGVLGNQYAEYFFVFADGVTASGIALQLDWQIRDDFSDTTHVSCSDSFPGGYAEKGSPIESLGEPQIITYHINRFKLDNRTGEYELFKECGDTFVEPIDISVVKTNDADGDGTFTDSEVAPSAGASVPFKAVITNNSAVPVVIDTLTDVYPGVSSFGVCGGLLGTTLAAGASTTCSFTVSGYAPSAGDSLTDTVTVLGHHATIPSLTDTASDTSTVSTPAPAPLIDILVVKTNDADGDSTFTDSETAPSAGASVPFQAVITNNSLVPVVITSLTDAFGVTTIDPIACDGGSLIGTVMAAGTSVTCTFSLTGYAPGAGTSTVNTVTVIGAEQGDEENTDQASDTSTVSTPEIPPVIDIDVDKTNNADGDSSFTDSESAPSEGAAVPFQAVITNNSAVPVVITSLTDAFGTTTLTDVGCQDGEGEDVIGQVLGAGASLTCTFTLAGYAPPAGDAKINTVTVIGAEQGTPSNTDQASDTSTVITPSPPEVLTIDVDKTNDADEDGTFTDQEEAAEEGASVTFTAVITNTSLVPVALTALTDVYPGVSAFAICPELIGTVIPAAGSVTCTFTLDGYAPEPNGSLTDTVSATVTEEGNPTNQVSDADDSTVTTPEVLPRVIERPKDGKKVLGGLAFTGASLVGLLLLAAALMLSGGAFAFLGRKRRREGSAGRA